MTATIHEIRELSLRSRRAQWAGFGAILAALLALPFGTIPAIVVGGAGIVLYGWLSGQERGAYRRLFREMRSARRLALAGEERMAEARERS